MPVRAAELPPEALLRRYAAAGAYTDCYVTDVPRSVSHAEFVEAFYTTAVFRLERLILRAFASLPSTDAQARQLAQGERGAFAAWTVEARTPDQLLLGDLSGRTKSWLMVGAPGASRTRLYFGSAVVGVRDPKTGAARVGTLFKALLGFHKVYSRVLLQAAKSRLGR